MTMTEREKYGRRPVPADKWVRATLEEALEQARAALAQAEQRETNANAEAAKAMEMMVLWRDRVEHLKTALETYPAPVAEPPPPPVPPVCGACGAAHWMNVVCSSPAPLKSLSEFFGTGSDLEGRN